MNSSSCWETLSHGGYFTAVCRYWQNTIPYGSQQSWSLSSALRDHPNDPWWTRPCKGQWNEGVSSKSESCINYSWIIKCVIIQDILFRFSSLFNVFRSFVFPFSIMWYFITKIFFHAFINNCCLVILKLYLWNPNH